MLKKHLFNSFIAICLLFSLSAFGQSESGSSAIEGTVRDGSGSVVSGASIVIKNTETGLERSLTSRNDGSFVVSVLPVGTYLIRVESSGFAAAEVQKQISIGEAAIVEITLRPQGVSEAITITAEDENIDSTASNTGSTLSKRAVQDLPVRGRNFTEFVSLTPAVIQESDRNGLVVAGQRSINSNIAIDGADFNDALQGNQRGGNESTFFFPQTAVREFQVVRSGATAEVGRTNAGFVNVVTKSGTNDIRGEAFYFNRNNRLTSPDAIGQDLDNAQNQFGGSVGGAFKKDKAFFFFGGRTELPTGTFCRSVSERSGDNASKQSCRSSRRTTWNK